MKPRAVNRTIMLVCAMIPLAAGAQKPVLREVASLPGVEVWDFAPMPNGRAVYYVTNDTLYAFNVAAKRASFVARGEFDDFSVSYQGDRIVFDRENEDGTASHIWTLPVDPATGAARGTAQRVSVSPGHEPRFSPDGKMIAFVVGTASQSHDLAIVPASGGPERVVAHYELSLSYVDWTADGKHLYTHLPATAKTGSVVERVSIEGGKPETLLSVPAVVGQRASYDGEFTFYHAVRGDQAVGRMSYRGPSGETGQFALQPGSWSRIDPVQGRMRRFAVAGTTPTSVVAVDLATGNVRKLLPGDADSRTPYYSPDGHKLAVETRIGDRFTITVMNADGTVPRTYALPFAPGSPRLRWSPDSRWIVTWADGRTALGLLEAATGRARVLSAGSAMLGAIHWRRDSKAVRFWRAFEGGIRTVFEVTLDGAEHPLRELPAQMTKRGFFMTDGLLEFGTAEGEYVFNVESGATTRLPVSLPLVAGHPSLDGARLLFLLSAGEGRRGRIQVMTAGGDSVRTVDLPFEAVNSGEPFGPFHPDGRHVLMIGRHAGDKTLRLFSVPLNGDAPREIASLPGVVSGDHMEVSPDGRTVLYTAQRPTNSTIFELDLSPLKRQASKP